MILECFLCFLLISLYFSILCVYIVYMIKLLYVHNRALSVQKDGGRLPDGFLWFCTE